MLSRCIWRLRCRLEKSTLPSGKRSLALGFVQIPSLLTSRRPSCFFVHNKEFEVYDKQLNLLGNEERGAVLAAVLPGIHKSDWPSSNRLHRSAPITLHVSHAVMTRRSFSTDTSSEVGAIDPDTARAQRKEQRREEAVKTNADCFLWFYNTFGHWDVERGYKTPDSETIVLGDGRVVSVPEHIRGRSLNSVWREYLFAKSRKSSMAVHGLEKYGVPSPSEMRVLIDKHRAQEKHNKPEYLVLRGFRWYYDTHGDWRIPTSFVIPADASAPEELHGMRVGEKWYGYACLNVYSDWEEEMRSLGIPDRQTARQARRPFNISDQRDARHRERARQAASAFRWYYDAYGHWNIPEKYQVPDTDSIQLANGTTVPVPVELRGLRMGRRWMFYLCKTNYQSFWSEFEQQGVPLPDEANYVLHTTEKLDAERGSQRDVEMQINAEAFRWFFDTFGHWDIQQYYSIPTESVVKVRGKEVAVPAHLRGLRIGRRWLLYLQSQANLSSNQLWTSKYNLPDPEAAKTLIKQHRRDLAEGKVEGDWSVDNKDLLVALENAHAYLDFHRTYGHWRIPTSYRVNNENIGHRWNRYIQQHTYGEYREELALTGLPDPKTAYELAKKRKTAKAKRR